MRPGGTEEQKYFNPRSPHGERHLSDWLLLQSNINFNPRSPHGERRLRISAHTVSRKLFQSTLPARGATDAALKMAAAMQFQSTLPARGATEHDLSVPCLRRQFQSTLPARGATPRLSARHDLPGFQSTLPARGATLVGKEELYHRLNFNPRSPHGERQPPAATSRRRTEISIHAPRTGSDGCPWTRHFRQRISIHAPRTGSDVISRSFLSVLQVDFNPRSPHGERQKNLSKGHCVMRHFNPRSPHGERRKPVEQEFLNLLFQSTLPARGATGCGGKSRGDHRDFNPRSPHGERRRTASQSRQPPAISIHAPRTGSDSRAASRRQSRQQFQSTLPARGATPQNQAAGLRLGNFNPRSPHGERHGR